MVHCSKVELEKVMVKAESRFRVGARDLQLRRMCSRSSFRHRPAQDGRRQNPCSFLDHKLRLEVFQGGKWFSICT